MDFEEVQKYWDERASSDKSAQSTTQDYYLRDIEFRALKSAIHRYSPARVMDVGCGDARTTARLAAEFKECRFLGVDYSQSMVKNALDIVEHSGIQNLKVARCDVVQPLPFGPFEMICSTRCLINLPTWKLQRRAIRNISDALTAGGQYVMIENFIEGHNSLNRVRTDFGLPEISVRSHNLFFKRLQLLEFISTSFEILEEVNISSTYYLVSRVIYSRICQDCDTDPDYFDIHHKYAAQLPFCGEFGPVRMICMRRR